MIKKLLLIILLLVSLTGCSSSERWSDSIYATYINTDSLELAVPVYDSVNIPSEAMYAGVLHYPEWKPFPTTGNKVIAPLFAKQMVDVDEEELYFSVEVPHNYVAGSNLSFYIHYSYMSDTVGDTGKFGIEYTWANQEELYGSSSKIYRVLTSTNNDKYYHHWVGFTQINGTGKTLGSILVCRIFRNSSSAEDTYAGFVALLGVDMVYEANKIGSSNKTY